MDIHGRLKESIAQVRWHHIEHFLFISFFVVVVGLVFVQLAYPYGSTAPGAHVDGVDVGGLPFDEAAAKVEGVYSDQTVVVHLEDSAATYATIPLASFATASSDTAVQAAKYPVWLRFVPGSLFWAGNISGGVRSNLVRDVDAARNEAITALGESCELSVKDASIKDQDGTFVVDPSHPGGTCAIDAVTLSLMEENFTAVGDNAVYVALKDVVQPTVKDETAQKLVDTLESRLNEDVSVLVNDETVKIPAETVRKWLVFETKGDGIVVTGDVSLADEQVSRLFAEKVDKDASDVTIKVKDFVEVSRSDGDGAQLYIEGTVDSIVGYVSGANDQAGVVTTVIEGNKTYKYSYSDPDAELSAKIKALTQKLPGKYGAQLIKLYGDHASAGFDSTSEYFYPASTYKLFVAYSLLRQIEAGNMAWGDAILGSESVSECLADMIEISDNDCAHAFIYAIGQDTLNSDLAELGLTQSRFVSGSPESSPRDLARLLAMLETGQLYISGESRQILIDHMLKNVYVKGVPSGVSWEVADKVGFIDALLHDASIVYSDNGTYVLVIMTDNSSWANIATLASGIDKLLAK